MIISSQTPIVSVIVPAYNYAHYLAECIESVLAQSFQSWECLVIDNGSTDNTREVVHKFVTKDPRVKYFFTEQKGVSAARNKAAYMASGEYIFPLDADDKIAPSYLEKAVKIIEAGRAIKLVYCDATLFGASSGKWILPEFTLQNLLVENSIFCSALYRKSDFESVGGYNENMKEGFEDWDFWIKLLKDGGKVFKIPEILFHYRIKAGSRNSLDKETQLKLRNRIFVNHRDLYEKSFSLPDLIFENHTLTLENKALRNSKDLKAGAMILGPVRFLKKIFKR